MINKIKSYSGYILVLICVGLLGRNIYLRLERDKYKDISLHKSELVSQQDSLIKTSVVNDSTLVNEYDVLNIPSISKQLIKDKIDSLKSIGIIDNKNPVGKYYTRTSFSTSLVNAKATRINDSISEYTDKNWYVNFNRYSDIINARYSGETEILVYDNPTFTNKVFNTSPTLKTSKWFNDPNIKVNSSETIYVPIEQKKSKFNIYTNTEFRQGVTKGSGKYDVDFKPNTSSLYQGIGVEYRKDHHSVSGEYNQRIFGEGLNASEVSIKYKYNLFK